MIRILQETTDWGEYNISNGIYYVNEHGHLVGYKPSGGRNNQGRITSSNRGGKSKNKKNLRVIDYTRELGNYSKCEVKRIENNPYGSA